MSTIAYARPGEISIQAEARPAFYTGKTVNAVKASRTNIDEDTSSVSTTADTVLQKGSVLCRDFYGWDQGKGMDYTRPATGILHEQKVVVVQLLNRKYPDTISSDGPGRMCMVVDMSGEIDVLIKDASVTYATGKLGVTNGSFALVDLDFPANTGSVLTDNSGGTAGGTIAAGVGVYKIIHPLTSLATGLSTAAIDILTNLTVGHRFKLIDFSFVTTVAGTGSSASQVFNLEIGNPGTNVTGGVLTLTLASQSAIGVVTAATAITAANIGSATDVMSIEMAASGTVFTAGGGYFVITVQNLDLADAVASLAKVDSAAADVFIRGCAVPVDPALSATDLSGNNAALKRCRFGVSGVIKCLP